MICIDIVGPILPINNGFQYILGIIDVFSRYVKFTPLKVINAKSIAQKIMDVWISYFGIPKIIHSDNGAQFHSDLIKELCLNLGIRQTFSAPYYHKGNAVIERSFRTMEDMLYSTVQSSGKNWTDALPLVEMGMRNRRIAGSKYTPQEIIFGKHMEIYPYSKQEDTPDLTISERDIDDHVMEYDRRRLHIRNERIRDQGKEKEINQHSIQVGQWVMVKKEGKCGIMNSRYFGPCEVIQILLHNNLLLRFDGKQLRRNVAQIKKCKGVFPKRKLRDSTVKKEEENQRGKLRKNVKPPERFL